MKQRMSMKPDEAIMHLHLQLCWCRHVFILVFRQAAPRAHMSRLPICARVYPLPLPRRRMWAPLLAPPPLSHPLAHAPLLPPSLVPVAPLFLTHTPAHMRRNTHTHKHSACAHATGKAPCTEKLQVFHS